MCEGNASQQNPVGVSESERSERGQDGGQRAKRVDPIKKQFPQTGTP